MATRPNHTHDEPSAIRTSKLKINATGVWEVHWSEGGRSRRRSCNTKDAAEARRWLKDWQDEIRAGVRQAQQARGLTVDELCERWLTHVAPQGKAETGGYALKVVRRCLGDQTVEGLTDGIALQDYADMRGAANGTIRRELGALRTVLLWAARRRLVASVAVPAFELPPAGAPRSAFLDRAQQAWFWECALGWGHRARGCQRDQDTAWRVMLFACLGLDTAARRGAIYELTWDRVDLERRLIDYRVPGQRVTKKRKAIVAISDRLLPVLVEARGRASVDASGQAVGRVINAQIRGGFETFVKTIGVPWVTPHVLRHTYASLAAMNGVGVWDIAKMMGDTIATIEANYMHLAPGHLLHAANHYTQGQGALP